MAIRYISRLTGITLGDSGIKAQERQKIFVFDLKIPIFWTAFRYITVPLCFIAANSALKRLMHVTLFCKAVIKGSIGSDGKHVLQPGRWIFPSIIFLPVHRTPPLSASSYHNFRFLQANSPPSVLFRKECRLSPFYFSEIALVAVFPLHLTGICGMIQDVFLFLFAAAMPEGSPARRQGNGSNTHTFLLETERTRYIWDSLRKFSERTVSGS